MDRDVLDCFVVGGGPAGLTAAIYLARYRLRVVVADDNRGRAPLICCSRNLPGFAGGISGRDLLDRLRQQTAQFGATLKPCRIERLEREEGGFRVRSNRESFMARTILLATGVTDIRPDRLDDSIHEAGLEAGVIRYCPICDGYEVIGKSVAIIGDGDHAIREAEFLHAYTAKLSLIVSDTSQFDAEQANRIREAGISLIGGPASGFRVEAGRLVVQLPEGSRAFDAVYPAMGSQAHSELASQAGARLNASGCIIVNSHQETSVEGLFAAGDVVEGLDQISTAFGQAAKAATAIRARLMSHQPQ